MMYNTELILVGGSGDDARSFDPLIAELHKVLPHIHVVTFSFLGTITQRDVPLHSQVNDLKQVLTQSIQRNNKKVYIAATSQGAYSTTHTLVDDVLGSYISRCIFIDPADYYIDDTIKTSQVRTWSGVMSYLPNKKTISSLMKEIKSNVIIDVIHFTLRNYGKDGYGNPNERGDDNPHMFPRLNTNMVQSFYLNAPEKNRGQYIENNSLPHAFTRDGDIPKNWKILSELIQQRILK